MTETLTGDVPTQVAVEGETTTLYAQQRAHVGGNTHSRDFVDAMVSEVGAGRGGVNQLGSAGPPAVGPRRYVRLLNHRSAEVPVLHQNVALSALPLRYDAAYSHVVTDHLVTNDLVMDEWHATLPWWSRAGVRARAEKTRYAVPGHRQDTESESESDDDDVLDFYEQLWVRPRDVRRWEAWNFEVFTPHSKLKYGDVRPTIFLAKTPVFVEEIGEVVNSFFNTPIKTRMERCLIRIRALSLYRLKFPISDTFSRVDSAPSWNVIVVTQLRHGYARRDSLPLDLG
ncbi:hypothetical protein JL720_13904 [Aureococcus anophagefferens]|nr:hypothetical protein JL720_13904 [Aureococcus anophagefferens]